MNMPELVWKAYIDNEIDLQEYDNVRDLYQRLLEKAKHVKVYISFALFEASLEEQDRCREILSQAQEFFAT